MGWGLARRGSTAAGLGGYPGSLKIQQSQPGLREADKYDRVRSRSSSRGVLGTWSDAPVRARKRSDARLLAGIADRFAVVVRANTDWPRPRGTSPEARPPSTRRDGNSCSTTRRGHPRNQHHLVRQRSTDRSTNSVVGHASKCLGGALRRPTAVAEHGALNSPDILVVASPAQGISENSTVRDVNLQATACSQHTVPLRQHSLDPRRGHMLEHMDRQISSAQPSANGRATPLERTSTCGKRATSACT